MRKSGRQCEHVHCLVYPIHEGHWTSNGKHLKAHPKIMAIIGGSVGLLESKSKFDHQAIHRKKSFIWKYEDEQNKTKTKERSSCCIHFDHHQLIKAKDHRTLNTKVLFLCQPPASGRSTRNNSFLPDDISAEEPSHPYHQKILWLKAKYHEKCQILLYWSPIQLQRQPQD